jgi:hypothetical protein
MKIFIALLALAVMAKTTALDTIAPIHMLGQPASVPNATVNVNLQAKSPIAPTLYGIFFEEVSIQLHRARKFPKGFRH